MKLVDFHNRERFESQGRRRRTDLSHPIEIAMYRDLTSGEFYQVSVAERRYQKSERPTDTQSAPPFGDWIDLDPD